MDKLMTTQEVADYLNIKKQTLEAWRSRNTINIPYIRIGASIRYKKQDVEEWLAKHLVKTR